MVRPAGCSVFIPRVAVPFTRPVRVTGVGSRGRVPHLAGLSASTLLAGQCLKAALTLSAACLALPAAWSVRPSVLSRRFPVARPAVFLILPLAVWSLCLIFLRMLTVLLSFGAFCVASGGLAGECRRRGSLLSFPQREFIQRGSPRDGARARGSAAAPGAFPRFLCLDPARQISGTPAVW
jgi:hypothetical protein